MFFHPFETVCPLYFVAQLSLEYHYRFCGHIFQLIYHFLGGGDDGGGGDGDDDAGTKVLMSV